MIEYHFKILLRYRNIIVIPLPIIILIILANYVMTVHNVSIKTTVFVIMFLLFNFGDIFLTIFDSSCDESVKYLPYPVKYYYLILQKNLAIILITVICTLLISAIIIFMFNQPKDSIILYSTYCLSIIFPFISIGNILSSGIPKINSNNYTILRMVLCGIIISVLSIPFGIIMLLLNNAYIVLIYILLTVLTWYYVSIPISVKMLTNNFYKMVETK